MSSEINSNRYPQGQYAKEGGNISAFATLKKSKLGNSSNNLRIYPQVANEQIDEEGSMMEKETPVIDSNINSPLRHNLLIEKQQLPMNKAQQQNLRDMHNRHYSVDVSKFQAQAQSFYNSSLRKSTATDNDDQDNSDTKRWQITTNQQLSTNPLDQNQTQQDADKKQPETLGDLLSSGKNLVKFALRNKNGEAKKRHSEYVPMTQKFGSMLALPRINRRNGVAPSNDTNKQLLGRITFLNVQSAQNQALSDTASQTLENQQVQNTNGVASFMINKKLSLSWRFINILVLIQTFTNKLKLMGQQYKFKKLNESHYNYINDSSHIQAERKNTYQNHLLYIEEYLSDLRIFKWLQKIDVLKPEQIIVILWKTFIFMIIVSQILYIPIKIAFFHFNPDLSGINQILLNRLPLAACICDIFINFNLAFFSAEGVVVQDRSGIISNYLRLPFWLDLITTISLTLSQFHYPDLCFLLRIFQIYEIINYLDERFQFSQRFNTPFTLIKLIATIIVLAHIFGCGFYYMSFFDDTYNWVLSLNLKHAHWGTLYLKSIYFIIITMITVGFGDITPKNNAETIYILGIALLSCFQFGYTVNVIGSLFQEKANQQAIIKQLFLYSNFNQINIHKYHDIILFNRVQTILFLVNKQQV